MFFLVNIPFYWFGYRRIGLVFTVKTAVCVALLSILSTLMPDWIGFSSLNPAFGAILFGFISGAAVLAIFRHGSSLGGIGILALYLQDRTGFTAGKTQLLFDAVLFASAATFLPWRTVGWSFLGACVVNLVIAMNHRRDRYVAT